MKNFRWLGSSLLLLLAVLWAGWLHRYEMVPGGKVMGLADLRPWMPASGKVSWHGSDQSPVLRIHNPVGEGGVSMRVPLRELGEIEGLHIKARMEAHGLEPGAKDWHVGRLLMNWMPAGSANVEQDPIAGVEFDKHHVLGPLVAASEDGPALGILLFCHQGRSGFWEMSDLELIPVRERMLWRIGKWGVMTGFFIWLLVLLRHGSERPAWSRFAAALLAMVLLLQYVVPGPWKLQRPLAAADFAFEVAGRGQEAPIVAQAPPVGGESVMRSRPSDAEPEPAVQVVARSPHEGAARSRAAHPPAVEPLPPIEKVLAKGSWIMRLSEELRPIQPLLHVLQFMAPALLMACLLGWRCAMVFGVCLAFATEGSQILFGYGFDGEDLLDLLLDGVGLVAGCWLAVRLQQRFGRFLPVWFKSRIGWMAGDAERL